jgi:predicted glycosyltransferase involved in capsule biosynthesis
MLDLRDVSFIIPVRIDQKSRLNNLDILLRYLTKHFNTNIIVGESDTRVYGNGVIKKMCNNYIFIHEETPFFNRMKVINKLASLVSTKILVIQDTDVLLPVEQYIEATDKIVNYGYDLIYPYDGNFYNVPEGMIERISKELSVNFIDPKTCSNMRPEGNSVGGILFWDRSKFKECGGCNEKFISWGFEDNEIYDRTIILGKKIGRCNGQLYHLRHSPSLNSLNGSHQYYKSNEQEWLKVKNMSKSELITYTKSWGYNV